ncbi:unnamed protein product [Bursaphelenchus xylophilus]|uniref:(pine wood nematode) hypothetical protein n=1 Tax=Bursaphelenchus xylophilus TaxID=6326 RepID=A0A1I7SFR2_BURXY|nr:unnamed protein product [Bursaphelenchus xylophilus]CAG9111832.1 unnamed protein product [Bursaphelenchus xylophilus]
MRTRFDVGNMAENLRKPPIYDQVPIADPLLTEPVYRKCESIQRAVPANEPTVIRFRGLDYQYPSIICGVPALIWIRVFAILNVAITVPGVGLEMSPFVAGSVLLSFISSAYFLIVTMFKKSLIRFENHAFLNFACLILAVPLIVEEVATTRTGTSIIVSAVHFLGYCFVSHASCYLETGYWRLSRRVPLRQLTEAPIDRSFFFWHELESNKSNEERDETKKILGYVCTVLALLLVFANFAVIPVQFHGEDSATRMFLFWYMIGILCIYEWKAFIGHKKEGFIYLMLFACTLNLILAASIIFLNLASKRYLYPFRFPEVFFISLISAIISGALAALHIKFYKLLTEPAELLNRSVSSPFKNNPLLAKV